MEDQDFAGILSESDDEDYLEFLRALQSDKSQLSEEEQSDIDYNYMADAFDFDAEEYRTDKWVQVTDREVEALTNSPLKKEIKTTLKGVHKEKEKEKEKARVALTPSQFLPIQFLTITAQLQGVICTFLILNIE